MTKTGGPWPASVRLTSSTVVAIRYFFFVGFYTGHNIKLTREHTTEYTLLLLVTGEEKTCQEARGCGSVAAPSGTRPSATGCAGCNTDSLPNLNNFLGKIAYFFLKA